MGHFQESFTKVFPKLSQYKWVAKLVMCAEVIWLTWVNFIRPGIDAAGRYEFVKSDWPAIKIAVTVIARGIGHVAGSPAFAIGVFFFGFGFLYLDRRFGSATVPAALPAVADKQEPEQNADEQSLDENEGTTPVPSEQASEDDFPLTLAYGVAPIIKQPTGAFDFSFPETAKGDALIAYFTNEDLAAHLVAARITYFAERRSMYERHGKRIRVIENPLWLGEVHVGAGMDFAVHETHYLVLATQNRPPTDNNLASVEDHRYTDNRALGLETRALERIKTSIEIELTVDRSLRKTFNLSVNFKTFRLMPKKFTPKESAGVAETRIVSGYTSEKTKKS
ncbi:MAG: hypothetical protein ACLQDV_16470 [Candidatus Binataceae bacterium]